MDRCAPKNARPVSAYNWCLNDCLMMIRRWADENSFDGEIAYLFEAGHASQGEANFCMDFTFKDPVAKQMARLGNYGFGDKEKNPLLQSADMLAWLANKWLKRGIGLDQMRMDFKHLIDSSFDDSKRISLHYWGPRLLKRELELDAQRIISSSQRA
jgi:hypothetical protein